MVFPKVVKVRQDFPRLRVEDVGEALRAQCQGDDIRSRIEPGMQVAITAGSRGIAGIDNILRSLVQILKDAGASPLIVPAMGSHGGGYVFQILRTEEAVLAGVGVQAGDGYLRGLDAELAQRVVGEAHHGQLPLGSHPLYSLPQ